MAEMRGGGGWPGAIAGVLTRALSRVLPRMLVFVLVLGGWLAVPAGEMAAAELAGRAIAPEPLVASIFGSLFSGSRPKNLGTHDGHLNPCPPSPNCVSTAAPPADLQHAIAPWRYEAGDADRAWQDLQATVRSADGATIVRATEGGYLYAEFETPLLGFVDDVEFYLDRDAGEIQVRSASRLGESDLGLNRQRIERLHAQFERRQLG